MTIGAPCTCEWHSLPVGWKPAPIQQQHEVTWRSMQHRKESDPGAKLREREPCLKGLAVVSFTLLRRRVSKAGVGAPMSRVQLICGAAAHWPSEAGKALPSKMKPAGHSTQMPSWRASNCSTILSLNKPRTPLRSVNANRGSPHPYVHSACARCACRSRSARERGCSALHFRAGLETWRASCSAQCLSL